MENRVKQKKFVSLVLYLHNTQNEVVPFFQKVLPVFRDNFTNFEIVCVNDACTDGTIGVLKEYLEENHYQQNRIAVEINGKILPKSAYASVTLKEGDVLEIVSFVGGG